MTRRGPDEFRADMDVKKEAKGATLVPSTSGSNLLERIPLDRRTEVLRELLDQLDGRRPAPSYVSGVRTGAACARACEKRPALQSPIANRSR
jgi:hypothetical protein